MLTLCTCRDLEPLPEEVEAFRQSLTFFVTHVIKGAHGARVVGDEREFVSLLRENRFTQKPLAGRVQVSFPFVPVTSFFDDTQGLSEGDAGEGDRWDDHFYAKRFGYVGAKDVRNVCEDVAEPAFFELHDILV